MNFDYSDEEKALGDQARQFLAERVPATLVRDLLEGRGQSRADAVWTEAAGLGWPAVAVSEQHGGIAFGAVALCVLAEETGRAIAPLPMLPSIYLAADAIAISGSMSQRDEWLPRLASGEIIGTALLDPAARSLHLDADGRLHGEARPVPHGMQASVAIVSVTSPNGPRLALVDLAADGVARTILHTIDDSRPHAALSFKSTPATLLGDGLTPTPYLLARAAVPVAFEQLGGADACLEAAVNYAKQRYSFARPIGSYQAIKHRLADMYVANQLARSNAYYAAWALSVNAPELALAAATARLSATQAYEFSAAESLHIHGGMGFTWESDCHLHYRRSRLLAQTLQPPAYWHDQLAAALDIGKVG